MNALTALAGICIGILYCTSSLVAQVPQRFEQSYPEIANALAAGDQQAIRGALSKLADQDKQRVLTVLHSQRTRPGITGLPSTVPQTGNLLENRPAGGAGGGAIADYSELMNLIESTISPDVWLNAGGTATMSPFRQGVRINTQGVIERISSVKQIGAPKLRTLPEELAKSEPIVVPLDELGLWQTPSELRWISLRKLDEQLSEQVSQGSRGNIASEVLGGLCRIDYLAWDRHSQDWLLGGPAGNLVASREGDLVHRELKLPPVLLEDLLTIAHHVLNKKGEFGCSIDPDPNRLIDAYQMANQKASMRLLARDPDAWVKQWKQKLGFQKANVVGISQDSPTGYALLIADAHMKRLAFGLEPSVNGLANYWLESDRLGYAKEQSMVRWWFALSNSGIAFDPQEQIYHFLSSNVSVLSETQMMSAQGERVVAPIQDRAADAFAKNFTAKFDALQKAYPIYGRLRHIFDLSVAMEIIRAQESHRANSFKAFKVLGQQAHIPHMQIAPTQIESIVATRKRSDGTISAIVSGGVSIDPKAIDSKLRTSVEPSHRVSIERSPGEEYMPVPADALEIPFWR